MVVTCFPATEEIGVMQERVALPLMCTVQAPPRAMPQPNLVPVILRVSRRTQRSGMSGLTSTDCDLPFRVKLMAMGDLRNWRNAGRLDGPYRTTERALDENMRKSVKWGGLPLSVSPGIR